MQANGGWNSAAKLPLLGWEEPSILNRSASASACIIICLFFLLLFPGVGYHSHVCVSADQHAVIPNTGHLHDLRTSAFAVESLSHISYLESPSIRFDW